MSDNQSNAKRKGIRSSSKQNVFSGVSKVASSLCGDGAARCRAEPQAAGKRGGWAGSHCPPLPTAAHRCPDSPLLLHACSAVHGVPKGGGSPAVQEHQQGNCCTWRENHALIKGSQLCWQAGIPGVIQRSQVSFEAFSDNQPGEKGSAL